MNDRPDFTVTIYECPEEDVAGAAAVLVDLGLSRDRNGIHLGRDYSDHESDGEMPARIAERLPECAPGAVWIAWDSPTDEALGQGHIGTPDGTFEFVCDHDGDPVFTARDVEYAAQCAGGPDEVTGRRFRARLSSAAGFIGGRQLWQPAQRCPACKGPGECPVDPCGVLGCQVRECGDHTACEVEARLEDEAHVLNGAVDRGGSLALAVLAAPA